MSSAPDNPDQTQVNDIQVNVVDPALGEVTMSAPDSGQADVDVDISSQDTGQTPAPVRGQTSALVVSQAPAPGLDQASAPSQVQAQAQMSDDSSQPSRPDGLQPWTQVAGKIVIPPNHRFCRVAYEDPNNPNNPKGWKFCDNTHRFASKDSMREHLTVCHAQDWGDPVLYASKEHMKRAAANGDRETLMTPIPPRDYNFVSLRAQRRASGIVAGGPATSNANAAPQLQTAVVGAPVAFAQANPPPAGPQVGAAVPAIPEQQVTSALAPVLVHGHVPPPGTKFGSYHEANGRWYVQHRDGAWYDHGAST